MNERIVMDSFRIWFKHIAILLSCLSMVMMIWEGQKTDAAVAGGPIPEQSIRLRILANSDRTDDQLAKREIRDAIVKEMNTWVAQLENPQSLVQARATIRTHLPDIEKIVAQELANRGIPYSFHVELGIVPFPTKMYGGTVYPAGNYEALRVTLGAGRGQNWWCVLFPPLCFIDAGSGEAAAQAADVKDAGKDKIVTAADAGKLQVRFFLWDLAVKVWDSVTGWFA
ncbi:stage II sporulation protein R [Paenibacillus sediminis]